MTSSISQDGQSNVSGFVRILESFFPTHLTAFCCRKFRENEIGSAKSSSSTPGTNIRPPHPTTRRPRRFHCVCSSAFCGSGYPRFQNEINLTCCVYGNNRRESGMGRRFRGNTKVLYREVICARLNPSLTTQADCLCTTQTGIFFM